MEESIRKDIPVLVTGVAGFIGSHLAARLIDEGFAVCGADDLSTGVAENVPEKVDFIECDLAKLSCLEKLPKKCSAILHLAGQSSGEISFDDPVSDLERNTISTINLIRYGTQVRASKIIYASSMSVYGGVSDKPVVEDANHNPLSCYGASKSAAENYLTIFRDQLPFISLRMFNVYGPGQELDNLRQGMVSIYLSQAINNGLIIVKGSPDRFRDFIYIDDVVEIWLRSMMTEKVNNQAINVGTGRKTTVNGLLEQIVLSIPDCTYEIIEGTLGDQQGIYADTTKLRMVTGLSSFTELRTGLMRFVDWARSE